jgi:energy-coupling factor transport system ATP-binding protein
MITFDAVGFTWPQSPRPVFTNLSLRLDTARPIVLCGPSGGGKSTWLRLLNGLIPHSSGGVLRGQIRVFDRDPVALGPAAMSAHVGFVFQDPERACITTLVEDEVAFGPEQRGVAAHQIDTRIDTALGAVGLADLRHRALDTLSGGELQRVHIAAALAQQPRLLALDEPTSQLDPIAAQQVIDALVSLHKQHGTALVLAEHRVERLIALGAQTVLHITPEAGCQILTHAPSRPQLPPRTRTEPGDIVLDARGVSVRYGRHPALHPTDICLCEGDIVALRGRNGSGKSSLLRALVNLAPRASGTVSLDMHDTANIPTATLCRRIGYLPQDPNALLYAETVRDELALTLRNHGLPIDPARIHAMLDAVGLRDMAGRYPRDLSAGQRQRVALAAILVTQPRVLLLDEPTRGMDDAARLALTHLLDGWAAQGMAILIATHDDALAAWANRQVTLDR